MNSTPHIEVQELGKSYGGIRALSDVSLSIERGRIHSLVGENGAGKSTLGKLLAGVTTPNSGTILLNGQPVRYSTPREALSHRIAVVHQEISLVPRMSVLENVFLGVTEITGQFVNRKAMRAEFERLEAVTGFGLDPDTEVSRLPLAEQQKVEIARALARNADLIVFDEPTAPLTPNEAKQLYRVLRDLRDRGTTIVFVSHFLEEVLELSDTISVLKDGRHVQTGPASEFTVDSLIQGMLGRSLESSFPEKTPASPESPVRLEVRGIGQKSLIRDTSFTIRSGEIVGLSGMVGSGRTELARLIAGIDRADRGHVLVDGEEVEIATVRKAIEHGIVYLSESRKDDGLILTSNVRDNLALSSLFRMTVAGVVSRGRESTVVTEMIQRVDLRPPSPHRIVGEFSGGNQQKVLLGRCLLAGPKVLILDEPTRGVDVGAKYAIYELITGAARQGAAVLVISSDLEEIMGLAHRIQVMHRGKLVADLPGDTSEDAILSAAFGQDTTTQGAA